MGSMSDLRLAEVRDCGAIAPLFASYREFYGQNHDPELALRFLTERLLSTPV
jgi:hypothetical protein